MEQDFISQDLLFQIIAVLLHKLGSNQVILTQQDLEETLKAHDADRLIMQGMGDEMHIGLYNQGNHPERKDIVHSFH